MLRVSVPTFTVFAAVLAAASLARAGGVIIDGRAPNAPPEATSSTEGPSGPDPAPLAQVTPLTPTEQQIYLWAAMVLSGHDAVTAPGAPSQIIDGLDSDTAMGGCAQLPASTLSMLAALLLFWRRRRC